MSEVLLVVAIGILVALVAVALTLHWRLYKLRRAQAVAKAVAEDKRAAQKEDINRSIQIIARTVEARQVKATEASIRISVLLDALNVEESVKAEFAAFYKLAEEAAHIPILEAWQALPKEKRVAFDQELMELERKYTDFVEDAAKRIQGRKF